MHRIGIMGKAFHLSFVIAIVCIGMAQYMPVALAADTQRQEGAGSIAELANKFERMNKNAEHLTPDVNALRKRVEQVRQQLEENKRWIREETQALAQAKAKADKTMARIKDADYEDKAEKALVEDLVIDVRFDIVLAFCILMAVGTIVARKILERRDDEAKRIAKEQAEIDAAAERWR
eukprot:TRINITY_DN37420_c0_g1_i1.p1 TRINITY_DN37420_c0_g1~~TRINITY_DN37420_c0_g1_i1.p1  ORF type:complete len:178 (-),score=37.75 TRINITY_DN37420_c0_g1_i1:141-674(-)